MAERVFVHIGAPKSGTSYLQDRVARNREIFAEHGLSYPVSRPDGHFRPALDLIQRPWSGELKKAHGAWDHLAATVRGTGRDVLISHEILAAASSEQVARALASLGDAEVHIVLTARDFGRQFPAEWQENVKHRGTGSFEKFAGRAMAAPRYGSDLWFWQVQSLPDVLGRWSNGLLPSQVHVVTVPPSGAPPELLWERFLSVFGIDPDPRFAAAEVDNASLGVAEIMVLRRLNRALRRAKVSRRTYVPMVRELIVREVFAAPGGSPTPILPGRFHEFADEVAEEWVEWLAGSGVDVVGDLEDLRPVWPDSVDEPRAGRDIDRPRRADVADAAIDALAAVLIEWDRNQAGRSRSAVRRLRRWNSS